MDTGNFCSFTIIEDQTCSPRKCFKMAPQNLDKADGP